MRIRGYRALVGIGLLSVVMVACETNKEEAKPNEVAPVVEEKKPVVEEGQKMRVVAMINSDTIMGQYEYAIFLRDELTAQKLKYEGLLRQKESKLRADMEKFQREASTLTQFEGQVRQKALYEAQDKFQMKQEEYARKLYELEESYNRDIDRAINEFLDRYCEDKPYEMVLSNSNLGIIRWAHESLDITNAVLEGLNAEYAEQNTTEKSAE
ncbi:OmpH family outer membrane protein [bacterium SCSIO 12643]|nr:OmpH family outer membrane protein [bacterium SCSIO 12643]